MTEVFSTFVNADHILGFTLEPLSALRVDGKHPPTVATQLSVIAWNRYEFSVSQQVDGDVTHPLFIEAIHKRGTLKSVFDFGFGGVTVILMDEE